MALICEELAYSIQRDLSGVSFISDQRRGCRRQWVYYWLTMNIGFAWDTHEKYSRRTLQGISLKRPCGMQPNHIQTLNSTCIWLSWRGFQNQFGSIWKREDSCSSGCHYITNNLYKSSTHTLELVDKTRQKIIPKMNTKRNARAK